MNRILFFTLVLIAIVFTSTPSFADQNAIDIVKVHADTVTTSGYKEGYVNFELMESGYLAFSAAVSVPDFLYIKPQEIPQVAAIFKKSFEWSEKNKTVKGKFQKDVGNNERCTFYVTFHGMEDRSSFISVGYKGLRFNVFDSVNLTPDSVKKIADALEKGNLDKKRAELQKSVSASEQFN